MQHVPIAFKPEPSLTKSSNEVESEQAWPRQHLSSKILSVPQRVFFLVVTGEYLVRHFLSRNLTDGFWTPLPFSVFPTNHADSSLQFISQKRWAGYSSAVSSSGRWMFNTQNQNEKQIKQRKTKHLERQLPNISSSRAKGWGILLLRVYSPDIKHIYHWNKAN